MKTDARSRYTIHIIQSVFLDLLKEKPISKITVKEICEKADINRGTFYKHYEDIYDLMKKLEEAALNQLELLLLDSMKKGNVPVLITLLTSLLSYQDLIESLATNSLNKDFLSKLAECCSQYAISHLPSDDANYINNPNKQYAYSYLAGGTTMLIEHWLKTGAKEAPAVIAEKIDFLNKLILSAKL
ncbi:TetR/AcrR family transcriptional regulator [Clostridium sp. C105KSO13]|uniref:TetR/AcrR family transcriptional regulator n=1 Tax=Clostridium sp. C105KSO13 TaxID=1776045 RepID=UPI0007407FA6|nr:TetR/AcrR family transcriptional regulator [Clostridium sp. C105KSO13]CUX25090.1 Bacterial regulatory proteins, tetR family [Clostridium sp. C105KSO13]